MAFGNLTITSAGQTMLSLALMGGAISFTKVEVGDGTKSTGFDSTTELVHFLYELPVKGVLRNGLKVTVTSELANSELAEGYYLREIAIYAKLDEGTPVLFAYDNAGEGAIYIPAFNNNVSMDGRIRFAFQISEDADVTINVGGLLFADYDHTHGEATTSAAGFMSAQDKQWLGQNVSSGSKPSFAGCNFTNDIDMNGKVIKNATFEDA